MFIDRMRKVANYTRWIGGREKLETFKLFLRFVIATVVVCTFIPTDLYIFSGHVGSEKLCPSIDFTMCDNNCLAGMEFRLERPPIIILY